jgi:hypothetical protein
MAGFLAGRVHDLMLIHSQISLPFLMDPFTIDVARNPKDNSETNVHTFSGDTRASERRTSFIFAGDVARPNALLMLAGADGIAGGCVGGRHRPDGKENGAKILRKGAANTTAIPVGRKKSLQAKAPALPLLLNQLDMQ